MNATIVDVYLSANQGGKAQEKLDVGQRCEVDVTKRQRNVA